MSTDNGGPAFPRPAGDYSGSRHGNGAQSGMTLRDYFAAKAMQGLISSDSWREDMDGARTARAAYAQADYMLAERSK